MRKMFLPLILGLSACCGINVFAAPSGLAFTPTADMLTTRSVNIVASATATRHEEADLCVNSQIGLFRWLEAGYDYSLTTAEGVVNFKFGLPITNRSAIATGVQCLGGESQRYIVFTHALKPMPSLRVSAGLIHASDAKIAPFSNLEYPLGVTTLMLEGVGGDEPFTAIGIGFPVRHGLDAKVNGALGKSGGAQLYLELGTTFSL